MKTTLITAKIASDHLDFVIDDISSDFKECSSDLTDFNDGFVYITLICK